MERIVWNNRLIDWEKLDILQKNSDNKIDTTSLADGSVSDAEFKTLNWVTWNIQEQIDNLQLSTWTITPEQVAQIQSLNWIEWNVQDQINAVEGDIITIEWNITDLDWRVTNLENTDLWDVALKSENNTFTWTNLFQWLTWFDKTCYWNPVNNASWATITVDCSLSNNQKISIAENTTITFENLLQSTIFNFELNITWTPTINFVCKALPTNDVVPMYSLWWTKPLFSTWVHHLTLKMSQAACHFFSTEAFLEFTN